MESRNEQYTAGTAANTDSPSSFSLPELVQQMKQEESWEKTGRGSKLLQKTKNIRLLLMLLKAGTEIKPHQAPGPITVHCIEGKIKFFAEENEVVLNKGEMLSLQEFVRHSVEAVEESAFLLTVVPLEVVEKK